MLDWARGSGQAEETEEQGPEEVVPAEESAEVLGTAEDAAVRRSAHKKGDLQEGQKSEIVMKVLAAKDSSSR